MKIIVSITIMLLPALVFAQVGIGTTSPSEILDLESSNATKTALDINNTGGGDPKINFQVAGTTTFSLGVDNSDGDKFKIGTTALETGTLITIDAAGYVGIGNTSPSAKLDVDGTVIFNESGGVNSVRMESDNNPYLFYLSAGVDFIGISDATPDYLLDVQSSGATVAAFDRTTDDGTVISIQQGEVEEGTISVSGNTVSYNAFTGSHFAHSECVFERGMLVSLNGENQHFHNKLESELLYGIQYTTKENDSTVLGSYLSILNPSSPFSVDNPHQVMSVGNGDMWVTDQEGNIKAGDYLVSSSVMGHAMKDDASYKISYVVARAAEEVDWSKVECDVNGVRRIKISVFFESFAKYNYDKKLQEHEIRLQKMEAEIEQLKLLLAQPLVWQK